MPSTVNNRIVAVGSERFQTGFRLCGVAVVTAGPADYGATLTRLVADKSISVLLTHKLDFDQAAENVRKAALRSRRPVVFVLGPAATDPLRKAIREGLGADLYAPSLFEADRFRTKQGKS